MTGVDISAAMLAHARRKAQDAGLINVDFQEGDAHTPAFPDARVQVVMSASVIFFLPDPFEARRNWRRVLQPDRRVLFSTNGSDNNMPLAGIFRHLATYGLQPLTTASSYLSDAGRCHALLEAAGFTDMTVDTGQLGYYYQNAHEFWEEIRYQPVRSVLATLPPDHLAQLQRDLVTEVAGLATDAGTWRSVQVNFCRGVNPGHAQ